MSESKILYKVLDRDMRSPFQGFKYEIGKLYTCGDFDPDKTIQCSSGFYATDIDGLPYSFNIKKSVFRCEVFGKSVEIDQYKRRYEKFRLIERISFREIKQLAKILEPKLGYKLSEALFPVNPLIGKPKAPAQFDIELVENWASVWASVRASVRDSVRASVGASVWASVWASVGDSVRASVWASVWASVGASVWASVGAYYGSLFPNIKSWKYIDHKSGEYPFTPAVKLWKRGFVPSYDGKIWRLHSGKNAKIVREDNA